MQHSYNLQSNLHVLRKQKQGGWKLIFYGGGKVIINPKKKGGWHLGLALPYSSPPPHTSRIAPPKKKYVLTIYLRKRIGAEHLTQKHWPNGHFVGIPNYFFPTQHRKTQVKSFVFSYIHVKKNTFLTKIVTGKDGGFFTRFNQEKK